LEVEGRKTGPFSVEQILGLLAEGEIPETARMISSAPGSDWITVATLAQQHKTHQLQQQKAQAIQVQATQPEAAPAPQLPSKPFIPPPRPAELQPASKPPSAPKPELTLIDALRVTKERRAHASHKSDPTSKDSTPPFQFAAVVSSVPRKAWLIAGTAALLCIATWGMTRFIRQKAPAVALQVQDPAASSAAPVAAAPAAPAPIAAPQIVNQVPPPAAPARSTAGFVPPPAPLNHDSDRQREEQEREDREREQHERDIASANDAASQYQSPVETSIPPPLDNGMPPAPPPLPEQGFENQVVPNLPNDGTVVPPPPPPLE
jgi:hypothetical protein